jgi:adenylate cyclase, class 2
MQEMELKAIINLENFKKKLESIGAVFIKKGLQRDFSFDFPDGRIWNKKETLRVRFIGEEAVLSWKGKKEIIDGYKVRDEEEVKIQDGKKMMSVFEKLGMRVRYRRDLNVEYYELNECILRTEVYPQMFDLVELEGTPEKMEETIKLLNMERKDFLKEGINYFMRLFEKETGKKAKICDSNENLL